MPITLSIFTISRKSIRILHTMLSIARNGAKICKENPRVFIERKSAENQYYSEHDKNAKNCFIFKNLRFFHLCSPTEKDSTHVAVADIKRNSKR